ncbi:hypothetical protein D3C72_2523350 [compost metagenome]
MVARPGQRALVGGAQLLERRLLRLLVYLLQRGRVRAADRLRVAGRRNAKYVEHEHPQLGSVSGKNTLARSK